MDDCVNGFEFGRGKAGGSNRRPVLGTLKTERVYLDGVAIL